MGVCCCCRLVACVGGSANGKETGVRLRRGFISHEQTRGSAGVMHVPCQLCMGHLCTHVPCMISVHE